MSVTNNGEKQKRNKKKKKKTYKTSDNCNYPVYPCLCWQALCCFNTERMWTESREKQSDRGTGKSSHCNTDTCSYAHTLPNTDSYGKPNTGSGTGLCF